MDSADTVDMDMRRMGSFLALIKYSILLHSSVRTLGATYLSSIYSSASSLLFRLLLFSSHLLISPSHSHDPTPSSDLVSLPRHDLQRLLFSFEDELTRCKATNKKLVTERK